MEVIRAFIKLISTGYFTPDRWADDAVFVHYDSELVTVYFSPTMGVVVSAFDTHPCEKPNPEPTDQFTMLAGDARAWETHFPDYLAARSSARRR